MTEQEYKEEVRTRIRASILKAGDEQVGPDADIPIEDMLTIVTGIVVEAIADLSWQIHEHAESVGTETGN